MQGTPNNNADRVIDIDVLLAERSMEPVPVKLRGKTYKVRTDFTVAEVNRFLALMRSDHEAQAFTLLVGTAKERSDVLDAVRRIDDGEANVEIPAGKAGAAINEAIDSLPRLHSYLATAQIYRASKALAEFAATDEQLIERFGGEPVEEASDSGESEAS